MRFGGPGRVNCWMCTHKTGCVDTEKWSCSGNTLRKCLVDFMKTHNQYNLLHATVAFHKSTLLAHFTWTLWKHHGKDGAVLYLATPLLYITRVSHWNRHQSVFFKHKNAWNLSAASGVGQVIGREFSKVFS